MPISKVDIVKKVLFFTSLDSVHIDQLITHSEEKHFSPNEVIFKEGDRGDGMYIILSGEVRVYLERDGLPIYIARLGAGHYFGERAIAMTDKLIKRNASVVAIDAVSCLYLTQAQFQRVLAMSEYSQQVLEETISDRDQARLATINNALKDLPITILRKLQGELVEFSAGAIVFSEGDEPDFFYYLLAGKAEAFKNDQPQDKRILLEEHAIFGEAAIINKTGRHATVIAKSNLRCLRFDKEILLDQYAKASEIKQLFSNLVAAYENSGDWQVTQRLHQNEEGNTITTLYSKPNTQTVTAVTYLDSARFCMSIHNEQTNDCLVFSDPHKKIQLHIHNNKIVSIECIGLWSDLGIACGRLLENRTLTIDEIELFRQQGMLKDTEFFDGYSKIKNKIICHCMMVDDATILAEFKRGAYTIDHIGKQTGAGTVCRSCRPEIRFLLGDNHWRNVYVHDIQLQNDQIIILDFKPLNGALPNFKAGQHVIVRFIIRGYWYDRPYTLTCPTAHNDKFQIAVKREPKGIVSNYLYQLAQKPQPLPFRISVPEGEFLLDNPEKRPVIFIAGGIGVTPAIAFIRQLNTVNFPYPFYLDYSAAEKADVLFRDELIALTQESTHFHLTIRETRKKQQMQLSDIKQLLERSPNALLYFCGPDSFREFLIEAITQLGFSKDDLYYEKFSHVARNNTEFYAYYQ